MMPSEPPVGAWASVIGRPRAAELPAATNPVWEVTSEDGRSSPSHSDRGIRCA
jgi:hypothetical protein